MKRKIIIRYLFISVIIIANLSSEKEVKSQNNFSNTNSQYDSIVFGFKPEVQTWIIPAGVNQVKIDAYGAQGGGNNGGKGGRVQSNLSVTSGSKLFIYIGSQPSNSESGFNGG